jgi:hypothetical protein
MQRIEEAEQRSNAYMQDLLERTNALTAKSMLIDLPLLTGPG